MSVDAYLLHDPETGMMSNDARCQNVLFKYVYIYIFIRIYCNIAICVAISFTLVGLIFVEGEMMMSSIFGHSDHRSLSSSSSLSNHPLPCLRFLLLLLLVNHASKKIMRNNANR